jgi:hypothetical protein
MQLNIFPAQICEIEILDIPINQINLLFHVIFHLVLVFIYKIYMLIHSISHVNTFEGSSYQILPTEGHTTEKMFVHWIEAHQWNPSLVLPTPWVDWFSNSFSMLSWGSYRQKKKLWCKRNVTVKYGNQRDARGKALEFNSYSKFHACMNLNYS